MGGKERFCSNIFKIVAMLAYSQVKTMAFFGGDSNWYSPGSISHWMGLEMTDTGSPGHLSSS